MKRLAIFVVGLWLISGVLYANSNYKMLKNLSVTADQTHEGSVISWGGTLNVHGNLNGSIILIGGRLELSGQVEEDVIGVAADIHIGENALIKGDLLVIGGTLIHPNKSTVKGEYVNLKFDLKKIETTLIPLLSDSQTIPFLTPIKIILWLIIALIVFAVVPERVIKAEGIFNRHIVKTGVIGILSLLTFLFLLFMFIIMSFVIIGLPLLVALLILYFIVCVFGRTVMFYFIGIKFSQRFNLKRIAPALFIVMGVIFIALVRFIPVLGPILLLILPIFDAGIAVSFLLRRKLRLEV
jgi:hypothetical protein